MTDPTPAEELRQAAKLMREQAQAATPGPWSAFAECHETPDAKYIAGMHPGVALAVADWLETEARMVERRSLSVEGHTFHALKVARAFLGTKERSDD